MLESLLLFLKCSIMIARFEYVLTKDWIFANKHSRLNPHSWRLLTQRWKTSSFRSNPFFGWNDFFSNVVKKESNSYYRFLLWCPTIFSSKILKWTNFATVLGAKFIIFNTKKSLSLFQKCGAIINDKKEKSLQSLDKKLTFPI